MISKASGRENRKPHTKENILKLVSNFLSNTRVKKTVDQFFVFSEENYFEPRILF